MITIYNHIVDAKSWDADIPASIMTARNYYSRVDPRNFFAIIAPINQALILLVIILFWKYSVLLRIYFSVSFFLYASYYNLPAGADSGQVSFVRVKTKSEFICFPFSAQLLATKKTYGKIFGSG
jgi:hypothetical protein